MTIFNKITEIPQVSEFTYNCSLVLDLNTDHNFNKSVIIVIWLKILNFSHLLFSKLPD